MNTRFFTLPSSNKSKKFSFKLISSIALITLTGCLTTEKAKPLAPSPPVGNTSSFVQQNQQSYQPHYFAEASVNNNIIITKAALPASSSKSLKTRNNTSKDCSLKHRLDRKSVVAYQWGRNKLSLDIDGVNLRNYGGTKAIFIEYKLKLQPEKTKRELCLHPSNWQGLIGSGYNEFFTGERKSLWNEVLDMI